MSSNEERKYLANLDTPTGDLQYEIERLLTFQNNFSSEKTSVELSANGYYYDHITRKIMCYFCKIVLEPSESTFKHCHSCRYQVDSFPVYVYEDNDKENIAASSNQERIQASSENATTASSTSSSASASSSSSNVPNTEQETDTVMPINSEKVINSNKNKMLDMQKRLDTFKNWNKSVPVTPTDLAKNGFYYLGYGDVVKCAYCSVQLCNWKENDDVHKEHTRFSPKCPNLESFMKMDLKRELSNTSIHPNLDLLSERLKTFSSWPKDKIPNPEVLAKAGFYYNGISDTTFCFSCGGILKNSKCVDDPLKKHSEQFPNCDFIQDMKEATMTENISASSKASKNSSADLRNSTEVLQDDDLIAENCELKQDILCKICMTQEITVVFVPCRHLISCLECGFALSKCPRCHQLIKGLVKVIFS
ncbi:hypothetical protein Ahia01_000512600 [Argonauta hians]